MRSIVLVAFSFAAVACSGSLNVINGSDGGPEASIDAAVDAPATTYTEPACTSTATTYVAVQTIGGGGAPILFTGGWLYWTGDAVYGTLLGPTANPVAVFQQDDVYQSLASDGATLFFSSPTGIGSLAIGSTSGNWTKSLGGASSLAVDAAHLFWIDWASTHVNSLDKTTLLSSSSGQSLGVNVPTTDAGQLSLTGLSLTSNAIVVSMDGGNVDDWPAGGVITFDKSGNNTHTVESAGATSVIADETSVAWVDPMTWTVDTSLLSGGTVTQTGAPADYLAQNETAFFASGPKGLYRINKTDNKVTQLSTQNAGRVAAGEQCLYFYNYYQVDTSVATRIQIVSVGE